MESIRRSMIWTMDRRPLGRRAESGPGRACPIRRNVEGGRPSATEPQWPRINPSWAAVLGTRHSRVIGKIGAGTTWIRARPPASLPRFAASDTGGFAAWQPQCQAFACHRRCSQRILRTCGAASPDHRGPQAPRTARSRPWRRDCDGSLCRGGQGLWTLWTAASEMGLIRNGVIARRAT